MPPNISDSKIQKMESFVNLTGSKAHDTANISTKISSWKSPKIEYSNYSAVPKSKVHIPKFTVTESQNVTRSGHHLIPAAPIPSKSGPHIPLATKSDGMNNPKRRQQKWESDVKVRNSNVYTGIL